MANENLDPEIVIPKTPGAEKRPAESAAAPLPSQAPPPPVSPAQSPSPSPSAPPPPPKGAPSHAHHSHSHPHPHPHAPHPHKADTLPAEEIEGLRKKAAERDELHDGYLRKAAEFENYRKRVTKEMAALRSSAAADALKGLFPVLDNFRRALASAESTRDFDRLFEGVRMIESSFLILLRQQGVSEVGAIGETFDAAFHEAVCQEETDRAPDGTILDVLERGWRLGERLLKPARVRLAKKPAAPPPPVPAP